MRQPDIDQLLAQKIWPAQHSNERITAWNEAVQACRKIVRETMYDVYTVEDIWYLFQLWCGDNAGEWQLVLGKDGGGWVRDGGDLTTPLFSWSSVQEGVETLTDWINDHA